MASLYDQADLYDLVAPRDAAMEAFYVNAAKANGSRVLELACGSGRFTIPMAEAGQQVVGIDIAEPMLARARQLAGDRGVQIETHQLDMRDFEVGRTFDTIVIAANSIVHLLTTEDFARFFAAVARHLAPGGQLLFDCFVPSAVLLSRPGQRVPMTSFAHPDLGDVAVDEIITYDAVTQISDTTWFWSTVAKPDFHVTPLRLRQIYPQELPLLLQTHGFELVHRFGDFDRGTFGPDSYRQVCICRRTM